LSELLALRKTLSPQRRERARVRGESQSSTYAGTMARLPRRRSDRCSTGEDGIPKRRPGPRPARRGARPRPGAGWGRRREERRRCGSGSAEPASPRSSTRTSPSPRDRSPSSWPGRSCGISRSEECSAWPTFRRRPATRDRKLRNCSPDLVGGDRRAPRYHEGGSSKLPLTAVIGYARSRFGACQTRSDLLRTKTYENARPVPAVSSPIFAGI
jgi:hypothetical protein